jgi:hypothetical protein
MKSFLEIIGVLFGIFVVALMIVAFSMGTLPTQTQRAGPSRAEFYQEAMQSRDINLVRSILTEKFSKPGPKHDALKHWLSYLEAKEREFLHSRAGRLWKRHPTWDRDQCRLIVKHQIQQGMTTEQVLAAWGPPHERHSAVMGSRSGVWWNYGGSTVYFNSQGLVVGWDN